MSVVEAGLVVMEIVANVYSGVAVDRPLDNFANIMMILQTD